MKKTLTTIATALIMIASFSSFAAEKYNPLKNMDSKEIVGSYLEATTLGSVDLNKFLFADDFEYRNVNNKGVAKKKAYTDFLKANKGVKFDCKTSYEILDQSGEVCVAKATMKFDTFTRVDLITLNHDEDGWKVSSVTTSYPEK